MVQVALLQQWYSASDPEMGEALWDRVSFRRFVRLMTEVNRQLEEQGLLVKAGTLADTTLVRAQACTPMRNGPGGSRSTTLATRYTLG